MHQPSRKGSCILRGLAVLLFVAGSSLPAVSGQLPESVTVPPGSWAGAIELPRPVLANGQALPPGAYSVHLTSLTASPATTGALAELERWVEFRQGGAVMGRELASIVPAAEIGDVAGAAPRRAAVRASKFCAGTTTFASGSTGTARTI